ncbi:MAG: hypothetical protein D6820_13135 [Lentisphaerae bacterium]|nr:MAG: hypothetical protein D6820_13135 [Lentisphaerota bacterium]
MTSQQLPEVFKNPPPRNVPADLVSSYLKLTRPRGYWIVFVAMAVFLIMAGFLIYGAPTAIKTADAIYAGQTQNLKFIETKAIVKECEEVSPYHKRIFRPQGQEPKKGEQIYRCIIEPIGRKPGLPDEALFYTPTPQKVNGEIKVQFVESLPFLVRLKDGKSYFDLRRDVPWNMVFVLVLAAIAVLIPYIFYWQRRGPVLLRESQLIPATIKKVDSVKNERGISDWVEIDVEFNLDNKTYNGLCRVYESMEHLEKLNIKPETQHEVLVLPEKTTYCFIPGLLSQS